MNVYGSETIIMALPWSWGRNNALPFLPCAPLPGPHLHKRAWKLALRLLPFRVVRVVRGNVSPSTNSRKVRPG